MTRINNPTRHSIQVEQSRARTAAADPSTGFGEVLARAGTSVLSGVESVASFVPGGAAVTAMVRGAIDSSGGSAQAAGRSATDPSSPATGSDGRMSEIASANDNAMEYLELQQRMQAENQRYTTLSNVMKSRHETAKAAINNIR